MRFPFRRSPRRRELEDVRQRVAALREEVDRIEHSIGGPSPDTDIADAYRSVQRLRESMAREELEGKRAELEALLRRQAALEADGDETIALPGPAEAVEPAGDEMAEPEAVDVAKAEAPELAEAGAPEAEAAELPEEEAAATVELPAPVGAAGPSQEAAAVAAAEDEEAAAETVELPLPSQVEERAPAAEARPAQRAIIEPPPPEPVAHAAAEPPGPETAAPAEDAEAKAEEEAEVAPPGRAAEAEPVSEEAGAPVLGEEAQPEPAAVEGEALAGLGEAAAPRISWWQRLFGGRRPAEEAPAGAGTVAPSGVESEIPETETEPSAPTAQAERETAVVGVEAEAEAVAAEAEREAEAEAPVEKWPEAEQAAEPAGADAWWGRPTAPTVEAQPPISESERGVYPELETVEETAPTEVVTEQRPSRGRTLVLTLGALLVIGLAVVGLFMGGVFGPSAQPTPAPTQPIIVVQPTATRPAPTASPVPPSPTAVPPTLTQVPPTAEPEPEPAPAPAVEPPIGTGTINAGTQTSANLRAGPGTGAPRIAGLPNGTRVELLEATAFANGLTWQHIRTLDGIEGWVVASAIIRTG